jgi:hypothetical protein
LARGRRLLRQRRGGAVGGGYDNTDIGRIVTMSFIDAYSKLVNQLGGIQPGAAGTAEATPAKTFQAIGPRDARQAGGGRQGGSLAPGARLYPTGNKKACGGKWPTKTTMSAGC